MSEGPRIGVPRVFVCARNVGCETRKGLGWGGGEAVEWTGAGGYRGLESLDRCSHILCLGAALSLVT